MPDDTIVRIMECTAARVIDSQAAALATRFAEKAEFRLRDVYDPRNPMLLQNIAISLALVSRRFRMLVMRVPMLWTTVTDTMPSSLYLRCLTLSAQHPLTVVMLRTLGTGTSAHEKAFLDAVLSHRHRWVALHVALPQGHVGDQLFSYAEDRAFPLLATVTVVDEQEPRGVERFVDVDVVPFFCLWDVPEIKDARLRNVVPVRSSFSSVRALAWTLNGRHRTPVDIRRPLTTFASLRTLDVKLVDWHPVEGGPYSAGSGLAPICLDTVEAFTLDADYIPFSTVAWFVASVRLRCLYTLSVRLGSVVLTEGTTLQDVLDAFFSPGLGCIAAKRITLDFAGVGEFEPSQDDMNIVSYFSMDERFGRLEYLTVACQSFVPGAPGGTARHPPLRYFPKTMEVLDLRGVRQIHDKDAAWLVGALRRAGNTGQLLLRSSAVGQSGGRAAKTLKTLERARARVQRSRRGEGKFKIICVA